MKGSYTVGMRRSFNINNNNNNNLRKQLLPTKTYEKCKLQQHLDDLNCRMCSQKQETVTHIMSACSKIAQSLYTARHDKMLRPYYHYLLSAYGFKEESDHKRPWYQQRSPMPVIENSLAKINWNILMDKTNVLMDEFDALMVSCRLLMDD